ncbi:hypothetical protein RRG08_017114 [Elysia crispata]|uniref:Uncharacterized protein n=1 Tax=Elysia crispata TaxID=231223 RepID=A0AAE1DJA9_9GAST|nr:hypothetical protein RRG08_017114 [Elysia crispata]
MNDNGAKTTTKFVIHSDTSPYKRVKVTCVAGEYLYLVQSTRGIQYYASMISSSDLVGFGYETKRVCHVCGMTL